jgi:acyl-CoA reductase-like NAD-dependent aldehyde dehydrogenase
VYWNCGQDCCARSRAIVERPVHEAFVERLAARGSRMRVADPLLPDTEIGSLISAGQRERVLGFIERAKESGAELHGGGQVVVVDGLEAGNAISPAVIAGVDPASEIAREEVFGPVATVIPFDTEEEAIALANGTPYGLSGSLWTRDIGRAVRVAREVRSGLLSINSDSSSYLEAPFGGRKQSGIGREQGLEGLYDFTELKNVYVSDV